MSIEWYNINGNASVNRLLIYIYKLWFCGRTRSWTLRHVISVYAKMILIVGEKQWLTTFATEMILRISIRPSTISVR